MNEVAVFINQCRQLDVELIPEGESLRILAPRPLSPDFLESLHQNKPGILAVLRRPSLAKGPPEWHTRTVAERVIDEGICIFWSYLFGEMVAFVRDESFRPWVTEGIVTYRMDEINQMFPDGKANVSNASLRLIHETKKLADARVLDVSHRDDDQS